MTLGCESTGAARLALLSAGLKIGQVVVGRWERAGGKSQLRLLQQRIKWHAARGSAKNTSLTPLITTQSGGERYRGYISGQS